MTKSTNFTLRPLGFLLTCLALTGCVDEFDELELDESELFDEFDEQFRACTSLRDGVNVCQSGTSVSVDAGDDREEIEVTTHFDHDAGKAWVSVRVFTDDGYYCYADCIWTGPKFNMHPAHISAPNLWYWNYFNIDVTLGKGADELRGATEVTINGNSGRVRFLDAKVYGQGGGDDIFYVNDIDGGDGDDLLVGTNREDYIKGGWDNDTIYGCDGDDELLGQKNGDVLVGGNGDDDMDGGKGNDRCHGGPGNDDKSSCDEAPVNSPTYAVWQDEIFGGGGQ